MTTAGCVESDPVFQILSSGEVSHKSCSLCSVHLFCISRSWEKLLECYLLTSYLLFRGSCACLVVVEVRDSTGRLFSWLGKLSRVFTAWTLERCLLLSFCLITPFLLYLRVSGNVGEYGQPMFPEEHRRESSLVI